MPRPTPRSSLSPALAGSLVAALLGSAVTPACSSGGTGGTGGAGVSSSGSTGGRAGTTSSSTSVSSSTGGSGGTGGSTGCTPGETAPCYTGPAGTEGVGACQGGTKTCDSTGTAFGACTGEVVPKPETCFTPVDDNCDGQINEGCVCTPTDESPCYTGPAGTEGVGICQGGMAECNLQGTGYGACIGQVVPQVDNCATPIDEDCDGATPACTGAYVLAESWGGTADEEGLAIVADPTGDIFVAGYTTSTVDFGCGPLPGGSAEGGLLLKLDPAGHCLWNHRFQDGSDVTGVATDVNGNVFITGQFTGVLDLGGGPLTSAGGADVFLAKFNPSGVLQWGSRFGDAGSQTATGIAVDDAGNMAAVGYFQGSIDFGGGALLSAGGNDIYVVRFDSGGGYVWSQSFGDAGNQIARAVAIDTAYNTVITGNMTGSVDFGGGVLTSAGLDDVFVARFDPTGDHVWSKVFGDLKDQTGYAVRTDPLDGVLIAGSFDGTLDLGGASYTTLGGQDAFLLALDVAGNYRWSRQIGGANTQTASALAVDSFGNVALGGVLTGTTDLGGGPLTSAGTTDIMVAKYDSAGSYLWSYRFGDVAAQTLEGMAFTRSDELLLTGILTSSTDFGAGPLVSQGGEDVFVAQLAP